MSNTDTGITKRTLVIDCDPGCDDALALLLAIRSKAAFYQEIKIVAVSGNVPVSMTKVNAQKIAALALCGLRDTDLPKIEIYQGSSMSMMGTAPSVMSVHGRDGLGEVPAKVYPRGVFDLIQLSSPSGDSVTDHEECSSDPFKIISNLSGVEFYRKLTRTRIDSKYDLICTGPLTNIAMALSQISDPKSLLDVFDKIVVMGGAFKHRGNITATAEFNFYYDPIAVQVFLDIVKKCNKDQKVVFVPLDITERAQLTWIEIEDNMKVLDSPAGASNFVGKWTICMLQKYFYFHATTAQILNEDCLSHSCAHKCNNDNVNISDNVNCYEFENAGETEKRSKDIIMEKSIGKSGKKHLPRFCYLHDPLAMYFAMHWFERGDMTDIATVIIHTDNDEMRGTVVAIDNKRSIASSEPYTKGTKVRYLSPEKVSKAEMQEFKNALVEACGLKLYSAKKVLNG